MCIVPHVGASSGSEDSAPAINAPHLETSLKTFYLFFSKLFLDLIRTAMCCHLEFFKVFLHFNFVHYTCVTVYFVAWFSFRAVISNGPTGLQLHLSLDQPIQLKARYVQITSNHKSLLHLSLPRRFTNHIHLTSLDCTSLGVS